MRHQILVALDHVRPKDPRLSLGAASVVANLLKHQVPHSVFSGNVALEHAIDETVETIAAKVLSVGGDAGSKCDVILGSFVWNEPYIQQIVQLLRKYHFPGRIGLAGPQVSYAPKNTLETLYQHVDFFIRGYAEDAVVCIAKGDPAPLGVHWARSPDENKQSTTNLAQLPSPHLSGVLQPGNFIRWETQRGCPYTCSFCQHRDAGGGFNKYGADRIHKEILFFSDVAQHAEIAVVDPSFNISTEHSVMVLESFARECKLYACEARGGASVCDKQNRACRAQGQDSRAPLSFKFAPKSLTNGF